MILREPKRQPTHTHDGRTMDCPGCAHVRSRRSVILTRALHNPGGATPYEYTKGMLKDDALAFWNDAKALGLIVVGQSKRGAKLLALPSYETPKVKR